MKLAACLLALGLAAAALPAQANGAALGACLADHTSGKERKELATWIFAAMSTHPEIATLNGSVAVPQREAINRRMAEMVTRLLTRDCNAAAREAVKGGSDGFRAAFESLGRLAMQELMSDANVGGSLGAFERHLDRKAFESAFAPK